MINYTRKGNKDLNWYGLYDPLMTRQEVKQMKAKIEDTIKIDDGKHEGEITAINYKDKPYEYVDVVIKEKEQGIEMKLGLPFKVTENTALGRLLMVFGAKMEVGKDIEVDDYLKKGLKVEFMTIMETTKKGTFARIVNDSVKPLK